MVNQNSHGAHPAGQFCVKMMGKVCGGEDPTARGTLVDLTEDGMTVPPAPHVTGQRWLFLIH